MRVSEFIAVAWLALVYSLGPVRAERRVALVVGNDRYANLSANEQLQKAVNDARAVGGALRQIGFDVIEGENLGRQALIDKLGEATQRLSPGDTVFFFFAGHGVAVDGMNYILPSDVPDVEKGQATRLKGAAVAEEYITAELTGAHARVAVVVLDACRDNPFGTGTRSLGGERGLQPREPPGGVFTFYSASRGQAALDRLSSDDRNPNSVFSRVLVPALVRPGIDLAALAIAVREDVARIAREAGYAQRPAYYDETIGGQVYLAGPPPANGGAGASPSGPPADEVAWSFLKDTKDAEQLRRFVGQYPASRWREAAEERLRGLEPTNVALTLPARPAEAARPAGGPCGVAAPLSKSRDGAWSGPLSAAEECGLKPKDIFQECGACPEMVVVPAGSFTMGSPEREKGRSGDEGPQHDVTIASPFAVGRLPVKVREYAAYVDETGSSSKHWQNPGYAQDGSHPVADVTWHEAKAYVDWLAAKTGKPYRLLSEAEWEYAARGRTAPGTYPRFWFGDNEKELCQYGNFRDQRYGEAGAPCDDGYDRTSPAGQYRANAFGLYDMFGNVWQWTADCWHDDYKGASADGAALTDGNCLRHVLRGGSWNDGPQYVRAAKRQMGTTNNFNFGFRVARTLAR